ncbi:FixH family protein [Flavobacterium sp.]|uniref:FixH family protein n=1 Tax=Flavobacterium sp. TaxID=239 RepID=UPI0026309790|nr:FixH family protein [Flavobacterium sp.]
MVTDLKTKKSFSINWGTSIVIAFALFMTFILSFVYKVQSNSKYDNELVVEEYYKHDAHFQEEMVQVQNAHDLAQKPTVTQLAEGISIAYPSNFIPAKLHGKVSLYRPSNKKLDFEVPISTSGPTLLIPKSRLVGGLWDISLAWRYEGKDYLQKQSIYIQ